MAREEFAAIDRECEEQFQSVTAQKSRNKQQQPQDQKSFLMVEIRTFCGSGKHIQGNMTATQLRERIMEKEHIQVEESTLPVNDNEKCRAVKGYLWAARMPTKKFVTDQVTAMCPEMGSSGVYPELEAQKWSSSSGNSPWMQVCGLYPLLESKFPDIFTKSRFGDLCGRTSLDANLYE